MGEIPMTYASTKETILTCSASILIRHSSNYESSRRNTQVHECKMCNIFDDDIFFLSCSCAYHRDCFRQYLDKEFRPWIDNVIPCKSCNGEISFPEAVNHFIFCLSDQDYSKKKCRCYKCSNVFDIYVRDGILSGTEIKTKCDVCTYLNLAIYQEAEDYHCLFQGRPFDNVSNLID